MLYRGAFEFEFDGTEGLLRLCKLLCGVRPPTAVPSADGRPRVGRAPDRVAGGTEPATEHGQQQAPEPAPNPRYTRTRSTGPTRRCCPRA
jgi:hypothetical protein